MASTIVGVDPGRTLALRFWPRVDCSGGPDACWPWTGPTDEKGYGKRVTLGRRGEGGLRPHQVAWLLTHGFLPKAVCHHCDNPPCCNPRHLFAGDRKTNNQDMWRKGRGRIPHPCGSSNPAAKLTEAQVGEIRRRLVDGESLNALGSAYGVSKRLIAMIRDREKWAWL